MDETVRTRILDAALDVLRDGKSITLDSAARRAGMTKPGLMHHFSSKQKLMIGLIDHVADRWEGDLERSLQLNVGAEPSPEQRVRAYIECALTVEFDETDMIMFADAKLSKILAARWNERLAPWFTLPTDMPAVKRGMLTAVRLIADGLWFNTASGLSPVGQADRERVRRIAYELLGS